MAPNRSGPSWKRPEPFPRPPWGGRPRARPAQARISQLGGSLRRAFQTGPPPGMERDRREKGIGGEKDVTSGNQSSFKRFGQVEEKKASSASCSALASAEKTRDSDSARGRQKQGLAPCSPSSRFILPELTVLVFYQASRVDRSRQRGRNQARARAAIQARQHALAIEKSLRLGQSPIWRMEARTFSARSASAGRTGSENESGLWTSLGPSMSPFLNSFLSPLLRSRENGVGLGAYFHFINKVIKNQFFLNSKAYFMF